MRMWIIVFIGIILIILAHQLVFIVQSVMVNLNRMNYEFVVVLGRISLFPTTTY